MRRFAFILGAALFCAAAARAETEILGEWGAWHAFFNPRTNDGRMVCGMGTGMQDDSQFAIKVFDGSPVELTFAFLAASHDFGQDQVLVRFEFGNRESSQLTAVAAGNWLQATVPLRLANQEDVQNFLDNFQRNQRMAVALPGGVSWNLDLTGAGWALVTMTTCVLERLPLQRRQ